MAVVPAPHPVSSAGSGRLIGRRAAPEPLASDARLVALHCRGCCFITPILEQDESALVTTSRSPGCGLLARPACLPFWHRGSISLSLLTGPMMEPDGSGNYSNFCASAGALRVGVRQRSAYVSRRGRVALRPPQSAWAARQRRCLVRALWSVPELSISVLHQGHHRARAERTGD